MVTDDSGRATPLTGEWAPIGSPKLLRAHELFKELLDRSADFIRWGGVIERRPMPAVAYEFPIAPDELSLVLGDCLQNLRAALDHEVYAMTWRRHGAGWRGLGDAAFPIASSPPTFEALAKRALRGVSREVRAFIGSVQPYQPGSEVGKVLGSLNDLARIDRHRLLHVAAAQPRSIEFDGSPRGVEIQLNVEIRFVDPDHLGTDALGEVNRGLQAVDWTIRQLRRREDATQPSS